MLLQTVLVSMVGSLHTVHKFVGNVLIQFVEVNHTIGNPGEWVCVWNCAHFRLSVERNLANKCGSRFRE